MKFAKDKSRRMKDAINANRVVEEEPKRVILENTDSALKESEVTPSQTTPKLNTFLFLVVFPIVATGTLAVFNDDMREELMSKLGITLGDDSSNQENSAQKDF